MKKPKPYISAHQLAKKVAEKTSEEQKKVTKVITEKTGNSPEYADGPLKKSIRTRFKDIKISVEIINRILSEDTATLKEIKKDIAILVRQIKHVLKSLEESIKKLPEKDQNIEAEKAVADFFKNSQKIPQKIQEILNETSSPEEIVSEQAHPINYYHTVNKQEAFIKENCDKYTYNIIMNKSESYSTRGWTKALKRIFENVYYGNDPFHNIDLD